MTWATVEAQIISIVEGTTPKITEGGTRASFRYVTEAGEDSPARTRDFSVSVLSGSRSGPNIYQRRSYADVQLEVYYEEMRDAGKLTGIIVSDWEDLRDQITDPGTWGRIAGSGIESIALDGGEIIFEYAIEQVEGGRVLSCRFPVLYSESSPAAPTVKYENQAVSENDSVAVYPQTSGYATSFAITSGTLPSGLSINADNGAITGTVAVGATGGSVTVQATGPGGTGSGTFTFTVAGAAGLGAFGGGNLSAGSLQEIMELMSGGYDAASPTAGGTLTINGQSVGSYDYTIFDTNKTVSSFTVGDWFTATEDSRAALVYVDGNLTINSGQTVIPSVRKLLTCIYVNGDCAISGEISMSARGADHSSATGSSVTAVAIRLDTGATYSVPAAGGAGASPVTSTAGAAGTAGTSGGTGGGGGGGGGADGGGGAAGTSFTGGSGGGATVGTVGAGARDAATDGGPGGAGVEGVGDANQRGVGGGAGNGGGAGAAINGATGSNGTAGTGGILVLFVAGTLSGAGAFTADGAAGGGASASGGGSTAFGGGGSGGGHASILVLSGGSDSSTITPQAAGGSGGVGSTASVIRNGGAGGAGTAQLQTGV